MSDDEWWGGVELPDPDGQRHSATLEPERDEPPALDPKDVKPDFCYSKADLDQWFGSAEPQPPAPHSVGPMKLPIFQRTLINSSERPSFVLVGRPCEHEEVTKPANEIVSRPVETPSPRSHQFRP
jgi:hypothetical protein